MRSTPNHARSQGVPEAHERQPGFSHSGPITAIVMSPDGKGAVTRDSFGSLRVWTALDGTREPTYLPLHQATVFAIARSPDDGWTVAAIDIAGATHVYRIDDKGATDELVTHAPTPPATDVKVLTGGKRVLILRRDHSVTLYKRVGTRVARLETRSFRPTQLMTSKNGKVVVAVESEAGKNGLIEGIVRRFAIPEAHTKFVEDGGEMQLPPHRPGSLALSPTGNAIAFAINKKEPLSGWPYAVVKEWKGGAERTLSLDVTRHAAFRVHFLDDSRLLVRTSNTPPTSWIVDIKEEKPVEVFHPIVANIAVYAVAGDRVAMGYGRWLFVQETTSKRYRFMGYDALPSTSVAISPSGALVGWSDRHRVWIDRVGDVTSEPWQMALPTRDTWPVQIGFIDENHIGIATQAGVAVIDLRKKKIVAQAGPVGQNNFSTQWQGSLVMLSSSNARGIYELRDDTLHGPYLFQEGGAPAWLLPAAEPSDIALLLVRSSKLVRFTLAELRSSVSTAKIAKRFEAAKLFEDKHTNLSKLTPLAIDSTGARFYNEFRSGKSEIIYRSGTMQKTNTIRTGLRWVNPSPDGRSFVASDNTGMLQGFSTQTMKPLWSYAPPNFAAQCVWSADSRYFACASATGGYVVDGRSGKTVHKRCSGTFEVRALAANLEHSAFSQLSLCEP